MRVGPTLKQIRDTYGGKIKLVYRDFPLGNHARAQPAAEAALCAHDQKKFWEYHDKIFENQRSISTDDLKKYAIDVGLDVEAFNSCVESGKFRSNVLQDAREGRQAGVTGTPAFFINGRFLSGAEPFEVFKVIIDDELQR